MLHLVPRWQSSDRHVKLKTIMQDRPDLIESELSGLAFDSNQQVPLTVCVCLSLSHQLTSISPKTQLFKTSHIETMFNQPPPLSILNEAVYTFIDPAAGGPQSDYCVLSVTRHKGLLTVNTRHKKKGLLITVNTRHKKKGLLITVNTRHKKKGLLTARSTLTTQVRLPERFHKGLVLDPAVLDPRGHELVVQDVVEALCLERAERAHHEHPGLAALPDVAQVPPHDLVLVEEQEELDLQPVQGVALGRPQELQGLAHPVVPRVLPRHVDDRLLYQARDKVHVAPVQDVR
jgi:hypothetical protein